jgi:hypothetical protein
MTSIGNMVSIWNGCLRLKMEGSEGMAAMERLMTRFRSSDRRPGFRIDTGTSGERLSKLCGLIEDGTIVSTLDGPRGNMVMLDLSEDRATMWQSVLPARSQRSNSTCSHTHPPSNWRIWKTTKTELVHRLDEFEQPDSGNWHPSRLTCRNGRSI